MQDETKHQKVNNNQFSFLLVLVFEYAPHPGCP